MLEDHSNIRKTNISDTTKKITNWIISSNQSVFSKICVKIMGMRNKQKTSIVFLRKLLHSGN